jgi:hypothetical protein
MQSSGTCLIYMADCERNHKFRVNNFKSWSQYEFLGVRSTLDNFQLLIVGVPGSFYKTKTQISCGYNTLNKFLCSLTFVRGLIQSAYLTS